MDDLVQWIDRLNSHYVNLDRYKTRDEKNRRSGFTRTIRRDMYM